MSVDGFGAIAIDRKTRLDRSVVRCRTPRFLFGFLPFAGDVAAPAAFRESRPHRHASSPAPPPAVVTSHHINQPPTVPVRIHGEFILLRVCPNHWSDPQCFASFLSCTNAIATHFIARTVCPNHVSLPPEHTCLVVSVQMSAAPVATPALRIGDQAPNFTAETTLGAIDFHQWMGGQWFVWTLVKFSALLCHSPICHSCVFVCFKV